MESVIAQDYNNIEYIVMDGGSTDGTIDVIDRFKNYISTFISEKDNGIYDAMNKGIKAATGDIIGTLNADDVLAAADVMSNIANAFKLNNADILYGNLNFVDGTGKTVRRWTAGEYKPGLFNRGWMPPHPTFYCRRELFEKQGYYSLDYGSAGDYELMLRFMHLHKPGVYYLNTTIVCMLIGGVSNKSVMHRVKAFGFDLRAMRKNKVYFPLAAILLKPLRKINQFFKN